MSLIGSVRLIAAVWIAIAWITVVSAAPAPADEFRATDIAAGRLERTFVVDVDGDGVRDLVLVSADGVRIARGGPRVGSTVTPLLRFPVGARCVTVIPATTARPACLVSWTDAGLELHAFESDSLARLDRRPIPADTRIALGTRTRPSVADLAPVLGGVPMAIAPHYDHLAVHDLRPAKDTNPPPPTRLAFRPTHRLHITGGDPFDRLIEEITLPRIVSGDANGDGRRDLLLVEPSRITIFTTDEGGALGTIAAGRITLEPPQPTSRLLQSKAAPIVVDVDGDGAVDVVNPEAAHGRITVRFGPLLARTDTRPDAQLRFGGLVLAVRAQDVDRDGTNELLVATTPRPSLVKGVRMFLSQNVPLRVHAFRLTTERRFAATWRADGRAPVRVDRTDPAPKAMPVVLFGVADLAGDGALDLLCPEPTGFGIRPAAKTGFARRARWRLPVAKPRRGREKPRALALRDLSVEDVTGDGRAEVIVVHDDGVRVFRRG